MKNGRYNRESKQIEEKKKQEWIKCDVKNVFIIIKSYHCNLDDSPSIYSYMYTNCDIIIISQFTFSYLPQFPSGNSFLHGVT